MGEISEFATILAEAIDRAVTREEAVFLLENADSPEATAQLFSTASEIRDREAGNLFRLDGFMGGTTRCAINPACLYCGRAIPGRDLEPWSATPEELAAILQAFKDSGTTTVEIGGGTTPGLCGQVGAALLKEIIPTGLKCWANYGPALNRDEVLTMKELGVEGLTCSFETINPEAFKVIKPGDSLEKRQELAQLISDCGVNLFSTMMVGVGESLEDRVNHLFYLNDIPNFYKLSISWLKVHPGSPLDGKMVGPSPIEPARVAAIARLLFRDKGIGMAGAQHIQLSIMAGANRQVHCGVNLHKKNTHMLSSQGFTKVESREIGENLVMDNLLPITARWVRAAGMDVEPSIREAIWGEDGSGD